MGSRLATMFARAGRKVLLGSRDRDRAAELAAALDLPGLRAGSYSEALEAPVVLPAVFIRDGLFDLLDRQCGRLSGKLLIDISNPFNADYSDFVTPWDTSGAEEIQHRFCQTRVVGAFKNVWWEVLDAPLFDGVKSDVFVVSDDDGAKREFLELVEGLPFRFLDAGRLANARTVERMTLLSGELGRRYDYYPRMGYKFLGAAAG